MDTRQWERIAATTGVAFVVVLIVGAVLSGSRPAPNESASKIADYFRDNDNGIKIASYLQGLGAVLFVWFLGTLWSTLRRAEGAPNRLATTAVGGGLLGVTLAMVGQAMLAVTAIQIDTIDEGATVFYLLASIVFSFSVFGQAALQGATAAISLRARGLFPTWYGWGSLVLAVVSLGAGAGVSTGRSEAAVAGLIGFVTLLLWVLVTSVLLFRKADTAAAAA